MTTLRIPRRVLLAIHSDLDRPHPIAAERVGFLEVRMGNLEGRERLLLASGYSAVMDDHYLDDPTAAATISGDAIRRALFHAMTNTVGLLHVHRHEHAGVPAFSRIDRQSYPEVARNLRAAAPDGAHGAMVLSVDRAAAQVWLPGSKAEEGCRVVRVGRPMLLLSEEGEHDAS